MATGSFQQRVVVLVGLMVSTCALTTPASAAAPAVVGAVTFTPIDQPTAEYTSGTCRYDLEGIPDRTRIKKLSGCGKLTMSGIMKKQSIPDHWPTWGSPPAVEDAEPDILASKSFVQGLDIRPTTTAGFELRLSPGASSQTVGVGFFSEDALLGSVSRTMSGATGALLFAATVDGARITHINISTDYLFAIANVRVAPRPH